MGINACQNLSKGREFQTQLVSNWGIGMWEEIPGQTLPGIAPAGNSELGSSLEGRSQRVGFATWAWNLQLDWKFSSL